MKDTDDDSGDWAEVCLKELPVRRNYTPGDTAFVTVITRWIEAIHTDVKIHPNEKVVDKHITEEKKKDIAENIDLIPYDEDETLEESVHLADEDVMLDIYYSAEPVTIE